MRVSSPSLDWPELICSVWSLENETMKMVGRTHSGLQRMRNEDALGFDSTRAIAVVADGMGGLMAGAEASRIVVDGVDKD